MYRMSARQTVLELEVDMGNKYITEFLQHMSSLLVKKNGEYRTDTDRWYNFNYGSGVLNTTPEGAAFAYMAKHIASVSKMVENPERYSCDTWKEKLGDMANYCALIYAMRCEAEERYEKD